MNDYNKKGYLTSNFKFFHLIDDKKINVDFHYHDFHKILIHLQGDVSYSIEGRTYKLKPMDIVFVKAGLVHRPIIESDSIYERIILYISPEFLSESISSSNYNDKSFNNLDLSYCFKDIVRNGSHVLRYSQFKNSSLDKILRELETELNSENYAGHMYCQNLFINALIQLNRICLSKENIYIATTPSNEKILKVIDYINAHLTDELAIDQIANKFFLSRYYLMHVFKAETGYTISRYISTKRLVLARSYIEKGMSINEACFKSGFNNYTTFFKAYKKEFGCSPKENIHKEANWAN